MIKKEVQYKYLRLVIKQSLLDQYEDLHKSYLHDKRAYKNDFSHNVFFSTSVNFLVEKFKKDNIYRSAPNSFIKIITRRGRRPSTNRSPTFEDKGTLFLRLPPIIYEKYINLIYSYALQKNDASNKNYSTSYFFTDFKSLINENYSDLIEF